MNQGRGKGDMAREVDRPRAEPASLGGRLDFIRCVTGSLWRVVSTRKGIQWRLKKTHSGRWVASALCCGRSGGRETSGNACSRAGKGAVGAGLGQSVWVRSSSQIRDALWRPGLQDILLGHTWV